MAHDYQELSERINQLNNPSRFMSTIVTTGSDAESAAS